MLKEFIIKFGSLALLYFDLKLLQGIVDQDLGATLGASAPILIFACYLTDAVYWLALFISKSEKQVVKVFFTKFLAVDPVRAAFELLLSLDLSLSEKQEASLRLHSFFTIVSFVAILVLSAVGALCQINEQPSNPRRPQRHEALGHSREIRRQLIECPERWDNESTPMASMQP